MKHYTVLIAALVVLVAPGPWIVTVTAQLSGAVNRYVRVLEVDHCRSELVVDPPGLIGVGDRILIHQAYGGEVDTSNTASHGMPSVPGGAGTVEIATVDGVTGDRLRLATMVVGRYDVASAVQVVRVAVYRSATTTGSVTASPWNGSTGGIVAIECTDTLFLRHAIEAVGKGFRGGEASVNVADTSVTEWTMTDNDGRSGRKGEGFVRPNRHHGAGRGPWSSGGGGGNARNGGGGGGGNVGRGGKGGGQTSEYTDADVGGRGGHGATLTPTIEAVFGGGGGGGQQNDFNGGRGGNGGGIVVLRAAAIVTTPGATVDVRGANGGAARQDGAGGGGAAGTAIVDIGILASETVVDLNGGRGGDAEGATVCYAPGGGGGGGRLYRTRRTIGPIPITTDDGRARGGTADPPAASCPASPSVRAQEGGPGGVAITSGIPEGTVRNPPAPRLAHRRDTICPGETVSLVVEDAGSAEWIEADLVVDAGATVTTTRPLQHDTVLHVVMIMPATQCAILDSVVVHVRRSGSDTIAGPTRGCAGSVERYALVSPGSTAWTWSSVPTTGIDGTVQDSVVTFTWMASGRHHVRCDYVDVYGCRRSQRIDVDVTDTLRPTVEGRRRFCDGDSTVLDAGAGYTSYRWSTGDTTRTIIVRTSASVSVSVTAGRACGGSSDPVTVDRLPRPRPRIAVARTELVGSADTIDMGLDGGPYVQVRWSDGLTAVERRIDRPGRYSAVVWDAEGCTGESDTIVVTRRSKARPLEVSVADLRYRPGERVGVMLAIVPPDPDTVPAVVDIAVRTRATMLLPVAGADVGVSGALQATIRGYRIDRTLKLATVDVRVEVPASQVGSTTVILPFTGLLGDSVSSAIVVDACAVDRGVADCLVTRQGTATNDELCTDNGGRPRLWTDGDGTLTAVVDGSSIVVGASCPVQVTCHDVLGRMQDIRTSPRDGMAVAYSLVRADHRFYWWQVSACGRSITVPVIGAGP